MFPILCDNLCLFYHNRSCIHVIINMILFRFILYVICSSSLIFFLTMEEVIQHWFLKAFTVSTSVSSSSSCFTKHPAEGFLLLLQIAAQRVFESPLERVPRSGNHCTEMHVRMFWVSVKTLRFGGYLLWKLTLFSLTNTLLAKL